ncbi:unnamed protein product, partial [Didymodactylos carnosus]
MTKFRFTLELYVRALIILEGLIEDHERTASKKLLDEILLSLRKIEHGTRKPSRCLKLYIQVILIQ